MAIPQDNRLLKATTKLGADFFAVTAMKGLDKMSYPYSFHLEMLSDDLEIDPTGLIGTDCAISIGTADPDAPALFHGTIWRFAAGTQTLDWEDGQLRAYQAEVVPWLKLLSLNKNSRIFQEKTVPEVIETIFKDHSFAKYKLSLNSTYEKMDFCVQWRESDYDFVMRLMEEAGIFFYFTHTDKAHTAVLGDAGSSYVDLPVTDVGMDVFDDGVGELRAWRHAYQMVPGKYTVRDYDFTVPTETLEGTESTVIKASVVADWEVYDYPGGHRETATKGADVAMARMTALERSFNMVQGESTSPIFHSGGKFKVTAHPVESEVDEKFSLVSVAHEGTDPFLMHSAADTPASNYSNKFECVPAAVPYRPIFSNTGPRIVGPQPAKVVGPKDSAVYTDEYGRIKVQFPWDREAKGDEKSSCWMRVTQEWAGKNWGSFFLPRVGQEVLVEFVNGDPNRPIVTGRVYNADNMPPHKLPDDVSRSGIKSNTLESKDGKAFNELRFDDTAKAENVYFHAQKDFVRVVENIDSLEVGYDKSANESSGKLKLKGDKGDQVVKILNSRTIEIETADDALTLAKGSRTVTITKGDHKLLAKAGKIDIEAGKQILLKVGANSIKIDMKGITITGAKVDVAADMKAVIESAAIDVKASAMLTLKGGMVKIN